MTSYISFNLNNLQTCSTGESLPDVSCELGELGRNIKYVKQVLFYLNQYKELYLDFFYSRKQDEIVSRQNIMRLYDFKKYLLALEELKSYFEYPKIKPKYHDVENILWSKLKEGEALLQNLEKRLHFLNSINPETYRKDRIEEILQDINKLLN